jgi:hypothetical protein
MNRLGLNKHAMNKIAKFLTVRGGTRNETGEGRINLIVLD